MLTERTIATFVTLFEAYLLRSDLAAGLRREFSPDQDVSQVLFMNFFL